jgi:Tol biopolymer transport system component/DNA-binding winged helix-turn-helix (wHTH) protein
LAENKILIFGPFRLDPVDRRLWRGTERVNLKPKVLDTLCYLVSNAGRVLPKEEIIAAIWPDRFVSEANLMQNISVLRRALGESETGTKFIGTFQGRGYEFLVPVQAHPDTELAAPQVPDVDHGRNGIGRRRIWGMVFVAAATAVLAWLVFLVTRPPQQAPPEMIRRMPLTRLPGSAYEPVLSRDGSKVAFVWRPPEGGTASLFVKGAEDDEARALTTDSADYSSPAWSPDGRYLAYLRHDGAHLQLMVRPGRGGEPRLITELFPTRYGLIGRHLDWSPDGRRLAVDDKSAADEPFGIYLIEVDTGRRTLATGLARGGVGAMYPRFSPDGKSVAFILIDTWFQHDLWLADLATGSARALTSQHRQISDHDWSPDGKVVYVAINQDGEYRIWKAPVGPASPAGLQPTGMAGPRCIQFSVSRADGQVVASELTQDLNIWRLDLVSVSSGKPRWNPVVASTAADFLPQISPDGTRLCFLSDRSGEQQLWVSNADGTNPGQLTRQGLRPFAGQWSPDGRKIIFHEVATFAIYVINAAGGVPEMVAKPGTGGHPAYSVDGSGFFYSRDRELYFRKFADQKDLLLNEERSLRKIPSRDGRFLYFSGNFATSCVFRFEIATRKTIRIVDDMLMGYWGAWTPGPAGLYYLAADPDRPTRAVIRYRDFATGRTKILTRFEGSLPPLGTSLWSLTPDGRYLYVVRLDGPEADLVRVGRLH